MPNTPSPGLRLDSSRLIHDLRQLQASGYPAPEQPSAELHVLVNSVAQRVLQIATVVAQIRYQTGPSTLGLEPADLGGMAAGRLLQGLPRLQLTGGSTRVHRRLRSWLARQVDWVAADAARQNHCVENWWWEACREDCWRRHWPEWRLGLLLLPPEEAQAFERELHARFMRLTYRELLRYPGPGSSAVVRALMRGIRSDLRRWASRFDPPHSADAWERNQASAANSDPEWQFFRSQLREALEGALEELDHCAGGQGPLYRRLLEMRHLQGLTLTQITDRLAAETGGPPVAASTTLRRLRRAEAALRALLAEQKLTEADFRRPLFAEPEADYSAPDIQRCAQIPAFAAGGRAMPPDDCPEDALLAAWALGLPTPEHPDLPRHVSGCPSCRERLPRALPPLEAPLARIAPPLTPAVVAGWPLESRRRFWEALRDASPPGSDCSECPFTAEPPAVDAGQQLVIRLRGLPANNSISLVWRLSDRGSLHLGKELVGKDGTVEFRAACSLPPGTVLSSTALQLATDSNRTPA